MGYLMGALFLKRGVAPDLDILLQTTLDENGTPHDGERVWAGKSSEGTTDQNCNSWKSPDSTDNGYYGEIHSDPSHAVVVRWQACNELAHLICLEPQIN